ncbi:MAG: hypothetical protein ACO23M_10880 [Vulcanococcus sp.]
MAKTYKEIQEEANRKFGNKASDEKFEWRKAQQREAGLETEAKKRGGYAGIYDRNKKLVSAAATGVGFLLGGPAGAAAARGGIAGLDRPGKSGFGFDVGRAAKGAMEGYAAGSVANLGKMGLAKLTGQAPMMSAAQNKALTASLDKANVGIEQNIGRAMGQVPTDVANANIINQPLSMSERLMRGAQGVGQYIAKKPELAAGALKEFSASRQASANRALEREAMAQSQRQFEETMGLRKREEEREVERQRRIAQMLAPLFQRIAGGQG